MKTVKVNFYQLLNFNRRSDIEKANRVKLLIENAVNNPKFRDEILKADFKDRRFKQDKDNIFTIEDNQEILNRHPALLDLQSRSNISGFKIRN